MSEVKSQRNLLNLLGSHNQSMAKHKFKPRIVQLQLKVLLLYHHCLNKGLSRSVGLNTSPPSPSHPLAHWSNTRGLGCIPSLTTQSSSTWGPLGWAWEAGALGQQITSVASNPAPEQVPVISEWDPACSMHLALLIDMRKTRCKHWTLVCVYNSHCKDHREWGRKNASLVIVWEKEKKKIKTF